MNCVTHTYLLTTPENTTHRPAFKRRKEENNERFKRNAIHLSFALIGWFLSQSSTRLLSSTFSVEPFARPSVSEAMPAVKFLAAFGALL